MFFAVALSVTTFCYLFVHFHKKRRKAQYRHIDLFAHASSEVKQFLCRQRLFSLRIAVFWMRFFISMANRLVPVHFHPFQQSFPLSLI